MQSKSIIPSLILCTSVIMMLSLSSTYAQIYNLTEEVNVKAFVNCEHIQKLFNLDRSMFDLGTILDKCWHYGKTLDELNGGVTSITDRPDIENYDFEELYLPCTDVFRINMTKLTTRLLQDFFNCRDAEALDSRSQKAIESRFRDIIEVYHVGNSSVTIEEDMLVGCSNFSKRISKVCQQYGLTEDQWTNGFLRYNYMDKWAVEEDVDELSMTCDQVFKTKLYTTVYENPIKMFIRCQRSLPFEPEVRDIFEKKNAEKLMKFRAQESPDEPGVDLRGFVSCRHLQPVRIGDDYVSASRRASDTCHKFGISYDELQNGTKPRTEEEMRRPDLDLAELYLDCDSVFDANLTSFTSALLNDYESCRAAGKVSLQGRRALWSRFADLFELFTTKRGTKDANLLEQLVHCAGFEGELVELCRMRGSTQVQELRGIGSLALIFGDKWLNAESLDKLYVHCRDLFDVRYVRYTERLPIDHYMQCKWVEGFDDANKALIDKRITKFYQNKHRRNDTRYRGDADVEISSVILFN